jgi:hypothetical protein
MEIHFKIIGILFITLALIHAGFPKKFNWEMELSSLSLINRQMMHVHTFFIALTVLLNGLLFFFYAKELVGDSTLAKPLVAGLFVFWLIRCIAQHFFYSSKLWKGKVFETSVHLFFSILWIYVSWVLGYTLFF